MKSKRAAVSPILSLAQPFEHRSSVIGEFELLGKGPSGEQHVAVFNRNVLSTELLVNVTSPLVLVKHAAVYELTSARGTVYGVLFAVDPTYLRIEPDYLTVSSGRESTLDFVALPMNPDRYPVQLYQDSSDTLLANKTAVSSNLVVVDE